MSHRETYPELPGHAAKLRIAEDGLAEVAFDARQLERSQSAERVSRRERDTERKRREQELIARDKAYAAEEMIRAAAEIKVREGVTAAIVETAIGPTPEWLAKGDTETYIPRQPDGTVAQVKTVRRVRTPIAARLNRKGRIDADELRACLWYRHMTELAGLEGRYTSTHYDNTPASSAVSRRQAGFGGHIPTTENEAEARRYIRAARACIPAKRLKFFDKVILDDVPITRAARFIGKRPSNALKLLQKDIAALCDFCLEADVSLKAMER